jgi:hypothetical protein
MLDAPAPARQVAAPGENSPSRHSLITVVVYDERYCDCRLFADALVARGAVAFPTRGDSAALWYGPLRAHLARHAAQRGTHDAAIIAGFTTEADRHISQVCARELALALLYEGAHDSRRRATGHALDRATLVAHRFRAVSNEDEIAAAFSSSPQLASAVLDSRDPVWRESPSRYSTPAPLTLHLVMPSSRAVTAMPSPPAWPVPLADALRRALPGHGAPAHAASPVHAQSHLAPGASSFAPVSALTPRSPDHPGYLTSWLLGPQPKNRGVSLLK